MTNEEREKAGRSQLATYLNSQYSRWRLAKILSNKKIIENLNPFYTDIISELKQHDDETGHSTINHEINFGLHIQAIAELIQYIEELFALIKFSSSPEYFARNIINYKAGAVSNFIKNYKITDKNIYNNLWIPENIFDIKWDEFGLQSHFIKGFNRLKDYMSSTINFYKRYEHLYNQYKHGLSFAFRFGGVQTANNTDKVMADKELGVPVFIFDNISIDKAMKQKYRNSGSAMALILTQFTQPHLSALEKEDNLLRLLPLFESQKIDHIAFQAKKVCTIYECLRENILEQINTELSGQKELTVIFPGEKVLEYISVKLNLN